MTTPFQTVCKSGEEKSAVKKNKHTYALYKTFLLSLFLEQQGYQPFTYSYIVYLINQRSYARALT